MRSFLVGNGFVKVRRRGGQGRTFKEIWFHPGRQIYFSLSHDGKWSVSKIGNGMQELVTWKERFDLALQESIR